MPPSGELAKKSKLKLRKELTMAKKFSMISISLNQRILKSKFIFILIKFQK